MSHDDLVSSSPIQEPAPGRRSLTGNADIHSSFFTMYMHRWQPRVPEGQACICSMSERENDTFDDMTHPILDQLKATTAQIALPLNNAAIIKRKRPNLVTKATQPSLPS